MATAAVCREFGAPLTIEEVTVAEPGPGEVRVTVEACAICHSDIMHVDGAWGGELPAVYGHEAAGTVESIGTDVTVVAPGDRVVVSLIRSCGRCRACTRGRKSACSGEFAIDGRTVLFAPDGEPIAHGLHTGAFAELALVDASQVTPVPDFVPWTSAALLGCGVITGFGAVANSADIELGSQVAVIGCGGVGINSLQAAALAGARTVIAVDPDAGNRNGAREFGATHTVDPAGPDAVEQVIAIADGRGVDYAFVTVGARSAIESAPRLVCPGGTVVIVGMTADGVNPEIDTTALADRSLRLVGSKMGSGLLGIDIPILVDLYRQGRLKLDELVTETFPLERINDALRSVKAGSVRRNVIVFDR